MEDNIQNIVNEEFYELISKMKRSEYHQLHESMSEMEDQMNEIVRKVSNQLEEILEPYTGNSMRGYLDDKMLDTKYNILSSIQDKEATKVDDNILIDKHVATAYQNMILQNTTSQEALLEKLSSAAQMISEQISEEKKEEHKDIERSVQNSIEDYVKTELGQSIRSQMLQKGFTSDEKYYDIKNILNRDLCIPLQNMYTNVSQKEIRTMKEQQSGIIRETIDNCKEKIAKIMKQDPNQQNFKQG